MDKQCLTCGTLNPLTSSTCGTCGSTFPEFRPIDPDDGEGDIDLHAMERDIQRAVFKALEGKRVPARGFFPMPLLSEVARREYVRAHHPLPAMDAIPPDVPTAKAWAAPFAFVIGPLTMTIAIEDNGHEHWLCVTLSTFDRDDPTIPRIVYFSKPWWQAQPIIPQAIDLFREAWDHEFREGLMYGVTRVDDPHRSDIQRVVLKGIVDF